MEEQQTMTEEEKKMIEESLKMGIQETEERPLPTKNNDSSDIYMKYCKPIAMTVLIISVLLLIYVVYTGIRRYKDSKITAGLVSSNLQPSLPVSAVPASAQKGGKKSKKLFKNITKTAKKFMRKMKGGNQCGGNQCGCAAMPPP